MKLLVVNGMGPTLENPMAGCFIGRRLHQMQFRSIEFRSIMPVFDYTWSMQMARNFFRKEALPAFHSSEIDGICYEYAPTRTSMFDYIMVRHLCPEKWPEFMQESLLKMVEGEKYDLVHAHRAFPQGAIANLIAKKLKIPSIITAHGSEIHSQPIKNKKYVRPTVKALEEADLAIFVSSFLKNTAMKLGFSGRKSLVIPNGIDTEKFRVLQKEKIKKNLGLSNSCFGFVGSLIPVKRANRLPLIFKEIRDLCPEATFLVVGDGKLRGKMEKDVQRLGLHVRFEGKVSPGDVPTFMNAMDVMLLPSLNEGWPCVVLEACACGTPVVGSNNGGIPEAVGEYGAIVEEGVEFEKRFAIAAVELLAEGVDKKSLIFWAKKFSWSRIVDEEIEAYEKTLGFRGG